jgi:restriction system protein
MIAILIFVLVPLLSLLLGIAIGRFLLSRENLGEALVANAISTQFQRPHVLLNNVTFQTDNGTAQIDHLVVADTGIFIIETKHYTGWIFGHPNDSHWTQVIYRKKSRFQNPIRQNYGHLKAVQSLFTLSDETFIPVVVFAGDAELKSDLGPTVLRLNQLISFLSDDRPVLFDERKMAYIIGRIEMKRMRRSLETDEYHLSSIRQRIQTRHRGTA